LTGAEGREGGGRTNIPVQSFVRLLARARLYFAGPDFASESDSFELGCWRNVGKSRPLIQGRLGPQFKRPWDDGATAVAQELAATVAPK
jgi:hypothetical protein